MTRRFRRAVRAWVTRAPMFSLLWIACRPGSPADAVTDWAARHDTTLGSTEIAARRMLSKLPSLPGDPFTCTSFTLPPKTAPRQAEALTKSLCRQQEALWHADRHEEEDQLGTAFLNTTFQHYGVVGVELAIVGPDGAAEWVDRRGVSRLADGTAASEGLEWAGLTEDESKSGVRIGPARLGWGRVDLAIATVAVDPVAAELRPALEWRKEIPWHRAKAVVRVFLLAEGTPEAGYVQRALQGND